MWYIVKEVNENDVFIDLACLRLRVIIRPTPPPKKNNDIHRNEKNVEKVSILLNKLFNSRFANNWLKYLF